MRYLLVLLAVTLQGCATGLLHSGVAKRPFPIVTPEMTLDYHPPKQISSLLRESFGQYLFVPDTDLKREHSPQEIMAQVCQLFPEFNPKIEMRVYSGISRREDIPDLLNSKDLRQQPDAFRKAWATHWFVYIPPNRIYINPPPDMLTQEDDNLIYLLKKPCK